MPVIAGLLDRDLCSGLLEAYCFAGGADLGEGRLGLPVESAEVAESDV